MYKIFSLGKYKEWGNVPGVPSSYSLLLLLQLLHLHSKGTMTKHIFGNFNLNKYLIAILIENIFQHGLPWSQTPDASETTEAVTLTNGQWPMTNGLPLLQVCCCQSLLATDILRLCSFFLFPIYCTGRELSSRHCLIGFFFEIQMILETSLWMPLLLIRHLSTSHLS